MATSLTFLVLIALATTLHLDATPTLVYTYLYICFLQIHDLHKAD